MTDNLKDIPFALARVDADGRLRDWNGAFLGLIDLSEAEAVARGLDEIFILDSASGPVAATVRACAESLGDKTCEVLLRTNMQKKFNLRLIGGRGKTKFCHAQLVPAAKTQAQKADDKTMGSAAVNESSDHADEGADFLAYVSHKLRTPVSGLLAVAELLAETQLSHEQKHYVELLSASGAELTALATHIQEMARLESGQVKLEAVATNIGALMRDCIVEHGEAAAQKRLNIMLDHADGMPDKLVIDRRHIRQVLDILIGNAIKYTAAGHIKLMTSFADNILTVRIEDTGIGIDESQIPALFKRGKLDKTAQQKKYSATGFGLLLVYKLVELLGGTVDVKSELGRGSCFSVSMPVKECDNTEDQDVEAAASSPFIDDDDLDDLLDDIAAENEGKVDITDKAADAAPSEAESLKPRPKLKPLNILVAEDNPVNQKLFQTVLEREGHMPTVVDDGQKAVSLVQLGQAFDIILMDISMPVMDGLDATAAIRSLYGPVGETPILALTAHALEGDRERFLNAGMSGYLSKPVNPNDLMNAIADLIADENVFLKGADTVSSEEASIEAEASPPVN